MSTVHGITKSHAIYVRQHRLRQLCCICILRDFKKAFDTVNHKILLSKFDFHGIRGVSHELLVSLVSHETNNIKFLGIIFDKHLTLKHYVDLIARKISSSVGILFKLSKYLPL